jgi:DNA-binding transcriptional regulator LsrR (DeoR family)
LARRLSASAGQEEDVADEVDARRLIIKVARLYHTHGMRQTDIAKRLQISQSRVSRLLAQAEAASLVRTVVAVPPHIHAELEEQIENRYGVTAVHVVDAVSAEEDEIGRDLAHAMAALLQDVTFEARTIGFTSWSRTLRLMVEALAPMRTQTERVVELLGDLGPPTLQHDAARSTQRFAALTGGQPVFLRTQGVVPSKEVKDLLLAQDPYARQALEMLDELDLALVGIGACEVNPALRSGGNFFTGDQLEQMRKAGAVGEVCLHFLDAAGKPVDGELDDLMIGISRDQLRSAAGDERSPAACASTRRSGRLWPLAWSTLWSPTPRPRSTSSADRLGKLPQQPRAEPWPCLAAQGPNGSRPAATQPRPLSGSTQRKDPLWPKWPKVRGEASAAVQCGSFVPRSSKPRPQSLGSWRPKPGSTPDSPGKLGVVASATR